MNPFSRKNGALYIEDVAIADIAAQYRTPFYVYSATKLVENYRAFMRAAPSAQICYSVKANSNQALLRLLAREGAGADIVSEGEGRRVLAAGIAPERIFFSGVGKSEAELRFALTARLGQINVESEGELDRVARLAAQMDRPAPIALRVNPDIEAGGHHKISTGRAGDKFGMSFDKARALYQQASASPLFDVSGLAMHIGSQILSLEIFERAFAKLADFAETLRREGLTVARLDLGGGLGIAEDRNLADDIQHYGRSAARISERLACEIILSPGRALAGDIGCLIASVIEEKSAADKNFLILDAAMNDLLRPTLYDARHPVQPAALAAAPPRSYELVGPVCESGDVLARDIRMPPPPAGALIAIMQAGAYGAVLSSYYNSRLLVPEILVQGARFDIIRPRPTYEELIAMDHIPDWLAL